MIPKGDLRDLILNCSEEQFNTDYLLSDDPWYFKREKAPCNYKSFREAIGAVFELPSDKVMLIGSGYFGLSLSPQKPFEEYRLVNSSARKKSDLDVVIISSKHFEFIWKDLIGAFYAGQHYVYNRYAKSTFKKFVSFDKQLNISDQGASRDSTKFNRILKLYDGVSRGTTSLRLQNEINFRVYRNREDMLAYQNWSISEFKRVIT